MKLEIIIPAYNCKKTLHKTLASLEAQTNSNFYVHLIDDCSTENFNDIIQYHSKLNIKVTRNQKNLGCGMTRQVGIDNTDADYIAFLDADDVLMPYTVEVWRNMAESAQEVDIFHSYFYEQAIQNDTPILRLIKNGATWCHGKLYKVSFIKKYNIRNNSEVRYMDDAFFNSMCTELGRVSTIPIAMYIWLNNQESITRNGKMTSAACRYDFIHAMIISTQFLFSKGVKKIKHMPQTLEQLECLKNEFDEQTINEYNNLLSLLKEERKDYD